MSIDGRDFTLGEFMTMVGTFGGWGMRIEVVPDDEMHERPKLKVREPDGERRGAGPGSEEPEALMEPAAPRVPCRPPGRTQRKMAHGYR